MANSTIKINISTDKHGDDKEQSLPLSGSAYARHQLEAMSKEAIKAIDPEDVMDDMYAAGFLYGLMFSCVPEDAGTYGMPVGEFAKNSYGWALDFAVKSGVRRLVEHFCGE